VAPEASAGGAVLRALAQDQAGQIWVGSVEAGLGRFDPATGRYVQEQASTPAVSGPPAGLPDARVLALHVDRGGTLWVGTWHGLARRRAGHDRFEPVPLGARSNLQVQALLEADDGRLWLGTVDGGLAVLEPASGQVHWLDNGAGAPGQPAAPRTEVRALLQAGDGVVWVGTRQGLEWRDPRSLRLLRHVVHDPRLPAGLAGNDITALLADRAGWVWAGGLGLGLQRHNPRNRAVLVRGLQQAASGPPAQPSVPSITALAGGGALLATPDGLVTLGADLQVQGPPWRPPMQAARAPGGRATGPAQGRVETPADGPSASLGPLAQTAQGELWLARGQVLQRFSATRQPLGQWQLAGGAVRRLLPAPDGPLFIGTNNGLYRLDLRDPDPQPQPVPGPQPGQAVLRGPVTGLALGRDGVLWVGGAAGLFRLAPGAAQVQPVLSAPGQGLASVVVLDVLVDARQQLWVDCAVSGLHRLVAWDGPQARFDRISVRHGVLNRPFGANLVDDAQGRIWTQQYVYNPALDQLHELGPADGKEMGMGWFHSHARTNQGQLLFGGTKGVLVVQPERFSPHADSAPVVVTEVRLDGDTVPQSRWHQGLRLAPGERSLAVGFAALDFTDPARLRYAYRLGGFDAQWLQAGPEQRQASYTNLAPGRYTLEVKAADRHGSWTSQPLQLPIEVLPLWWQHPAGRAGLGLAGLLMVLGLVRWRTASLSRQRQALATQVAERTAELEALTRALRQESAALQEASLTDPLTGLRNRRYFNQHIAADVADSLRGQGREHDLLFFLLDIDHFKRLNDQHGHAAGDAVLAQLRERLGHVFRINDHLVRWGGEEFLVVARQSQRDAAPALAERLRRQICDTPFELSGGGQLAVSVSIGFAAFPLLPGAPQAVDWSRVLAMADAALYEAKQQGRNGWCGVLGVAPGAEARVSELAELAEPAPWLRDGSLLLARSAPAAGTAAP